MTVILPFCDEQRRYGHRGREAGQGHSNLHRKGMVTCEAATAMADGNGQRRDGPAAGIYGLRLQRPQLRGAFQGSPRCGRCRGRGEADSKQREALPRGKHLRNDASSKSPSTPDSTNLLIISNIVNYPVLGHINLCPPATSLKGNTLIFDALAFSAVEGEFHEGLSGQCNEAKVGFEWDSCFGKRFLHSALRAPVEMTRRRRSRKQPGCRSAGRKGRLAAAAPKCSRK